MIFRKILKFFLKNNLKEIFPLLNFGLLLLPNTSTAQMADLL